MVPPDDGSDDGPDDGSAVREAGPDAARWLTPGVASVGAASFFSDAGHEMATSVLPTFLSATLGAGPGALGAIEGVSDALVGLSKLARLVDLYAKRPQVQERLTSQVADALVDKLDPSGVLVVIECEHLCMSMRGIRKAGSITTTSAVRGIMRSNASTRAEALGLLRGT